MDSPSLLSSNRVATFNESERWHAYSRANDRIQADLPWVATLKGDQFLLRSFKNRSRGVTASCVCPVITHPYDLPRVSPTISKCGTAGRFEAVKLRIYDDGLTPLARIGMTAPAFPADWGCS